MYRNKEGMSELITKAAAEELTRSGNLILVNNKLFNKDSPEIVRIHTGEWALKAMCANPCDAPEGVYYPMETLFLCVKNGGSEKYYIDKGECEYRVENKWLDKESLAVYNLVILASGDICSRNNCYYDSELNEWFLDDASSKSIFNYHHNSGVRPNLTNKNTKVCVGFEVEKSGFPAPRHRMARETILEKTKWTIEKDSSVSNGFELVSPLFDLYSNKIESTTEPIKAYFDVPQIHNAGGHITLSMPGLSSIALIDAMGNWIPIILSMYRGRLKGGYSTAATIDYVKSHQGDRKAIHNKGNGLVEFRIVSAVKSYKNFLWRVKLFRFIMSNLSLSFDEIIGSAIEGEFNKILIELNIYRKAEGLKVMLNAAVNIHNKYVLSAGSEKYKFSKLIKNKQIKDVYSDMETSEKEVAAGAPAELVG